MILFIRLQERVPIDKSDATTKEIAGKREIQRAMMRISSLCSTSAIESTVRFLFDGFGRLRRSI